MYKDKKILGVIVARGGSKGIPRKNIKDLCGKPLIAYTLDAVKHSTLLTRTILSTDDQEIADVAKQYGADVPFLRPSDLAQDKSTAIPVIQHALNFLQEHDNEVYDYVMILQPTSPFRLGEDIDASIQKIVDTGADSVMSMVELIDFSVKKLKKIEDDIILPLIVDEGKTTEQRDKDIPTYKRNCAIYLTKVDCIMQGDLFGQISRPYIMPAERSIDINKPIEFEMAEFFMRKKLNQ